MTLTVISRGKIDCPTGAQRFFFRGVEGRVPCAGYIQRRRNLGWNLLTYRAEWARGRTDAGLAQFGYSTPRRGCTRRRPATESRILYRERISDEKGICPSFAVHLGSSSNSRPTFLGFGGTHSNERLVLSILLWLSHPWM